MIKTTSIARMDTQLLDRIDALALSPRAERLKDEFFSCQPGIAVERARLTMESWKETEGEPIDIRSAKLLKKVAEGSPVVIFRGQMLAGTDTKFFRGANPKCDYDGAYLIPLLQETPGQLSMGGPVERGFLNKEDYATLIEVIDYWKGKTPSDKARELQRTLAGSWYDDLCAAGCAPYWTRTHNTETVNYERLINEGLGSVIAEAQRRIKEWVDNKDDDVEKLYFWQAAIIGLEAAVTLGKRYAAVAREMAAKEEDPEWRAEMEKIAEICQRVPEHPARTFREALQSIILVRIAMKMQTGDSTPTSVGSVDQYLYPFFKRDLEKGRLSLEEAADLINDLLLYLNRQETVAEIIRRDMSQKGNPSSMGLGGPDRQGNDASNELTYLFLHVRGLANYVEPHTVVRWHRETPHWLMRKALETNLRVGGGVPQFQNAEHIINYFTERGVPAENARYFQTSGCSEIVPWDWTSPMKPTVLDVPLYVDLALHDGQASKTGKQLGVHTGDPREFTTFGGFYDAFKKQCDYVSRRQFWLERFMDRVLGDMYRHPLTSAIAPGCLEKGKDYSVGGLPHYDVWYAKDRGMVDAGDCLTAVKKLVYDEKKVAMGELVEALDANFKGEKGEAIRRLCLAAPKYGNDGDEADLMVRDVARFTAGVIMSEKNIFGEPYAVTRNGLAWHFMAGKRLAALPNGRKAGEPLSDGSLSPTQGMDHNGPTAVLNSALKADYRESTASVITLKFPAPIVRSVAMRDKVASLTDSFFRRGGSYIQYNILDAAALREAKAHPEKYRDLVVRVGGFSAYFVTLSPEVQDEIISRTEHGL